MSPEVELASLRSRLVLDELKRREVILTRIRRRDVGLGKQVLIWLLFAGFVAALQFTSWDTWLQAHGRFATWMLGITSLLALGGFVVAASAQARINAVFTFLERNGDVTRFLSDACHAADSIHQELPSGAQAAKVPK